MANPLWIPGSESANPSGRPKYSVRSTKGMIERFVRRNITPNKLSRIFDKLSPTEQADLLMNLIPYVVPKQSAEAINQEEIERLHEMLETALKEKQHDKAI